MTLGERIGVLALGAALLLPAVGAAWKAASMRGDLFQKWNDRVALTYNGLSEQAADRLLRIQSIIADLVAGAGQPFDPLLVVTDPSRLKEPMGRFEHALSVRDRLRRRFRMLLRLGPMLLGAVPCYVAGVVIVDLYFASIYQSRWLVTAGYVLGGLGAALMLVVFLLYAFLQHKLSAAELLASEKQNGE